MSTIQGYKYRWYIPQTDRSAIAQWSSKYHLSMPVIQALISRGCADEKQLDEFLFSSFERDVAHPSLLKDADKAVSRLIKAIKHNEKILIFGDYDVDGITASSLLMISLLPLGARVNFFLPHRVKDGYGLSTTAVKRAAQNGYSVIVTVDNGITAFEPAHTAKEYGVDLIITDHHRAHDTLPDAFAVVNPNQPACDYPYKFLAGVGVGFKLMCLLYERLGKQLPTKVYELLLLGTVADVVPLTGENRFWVRQCLTHVNRSESRSLRVLKTNGAVRRPQLSSLDVGFSIAPQINALGRLEDPRAGVTFLIGDDQKEIEHVGKVLLELNHARKAIERGIYEEVESQIKSGAIDVSRERVIIAASTGWAPGVIGLVASRLVSTYGLPTLLFHITKDGVAKGSCRSIDAFNIFDALASCKDLITQFGGHAQAAGLALPYTNVARLKERLEKRIRQTVTTDELVQKITLDAVLPLGDATQKLIDDMRNLEPFGHCNAQPVFLVKDVVQVQEPQLLKGAHVKASVFADGVIKPVIFFNQGPDLFERLKQQGDTPFDIAAQVTQNYWRSRVSIELIGLDVAQLKGGVS